MMDDLVKRANAALEGVTAGPWTVEYDLGDTRLLMGSDCQMCNMTYYPWTPDNDADWHFIAAARELVPAMRNRIEADAKRIAELEDSRNRLDDRIAELVEKNGQACVRAETAEDRAEAAEARVKELETLLREARTDLHHYIDNDWPEKERAVYPSCQRKYERDMELCYRIDAALGGEKKDG